MSRPYKEYTIEIRCPKTQDEMLYIRRRIGAAYMEFVKQYTASLSMNQDEENMIYINVLENLKCK